MPGKKCEPGCTCNRHLLAQRNRERIWTEESKRKVSESKKGKPNPIVSEANRRRIWTEEQRKQRSKISRETKHTPEWNQKVSDALKGRTKIITPEWRENMRKALIGRITSQETKQKLKEAAKKRYKNPEYKEKIFNHLSRIQRPTSIEIILKEFLENAYPECEIIGEHRIKIPRRECRVDFAIPSLNLVFEADGIYWHKDKEHDAKRDKELEKLGWLVIRFGEKEIKDWTMSS